MPYIERDAFSKQQRDLYCKECARRYGVKNGKLKAIYKIGEAPCKSCELNDALDDLDDYPEADVAPVLHAHWIDKEEKICGYIPNILRVCSNCDTEYESTFMAACCAFIPSDAFGAGDDTKFPKCPCCGAKMDEETKQ